MDEDFDRARHRLRQEVAARNTDQPAFPSGAVADAPAFWAGPDEPEQVDQDMMANYNRCVIADAANITRPGHIDWLAAGTWLFVGLTCLTLAGSGIRYALRMWWR